MITRSEAQNVVDRMDELKVLESLLGHLPEVKTLRLDSSAVTAAFGISDPIGGRCVAAAVAAIRSEAENRIIDLKAELGLVDDPAPVAVANEAVSEPEAQSSEAPATPVDPVAEGTSDAAPASDAPASEAPIAAEVPQAA